MVSGDRVSARCGFPRVRDPQRGEQYDQSASQSGIAGYFIHHPPGRNRAQIRE
jgi:hypothetical protein